MTRAALLVLLLGGCTDSSGDVGDGGVDAGIDLGVSCPATPPTGLCASFSMRECDYPGWICKCDDQWYCRASDCPATANPGGACTQPGQLCNYGFEQALICVAPENRWVFCGGVPLCESNTTGALCCGDPNGQCEQAPACVCGSDYHVSCGGGDGGA